jgi:hypothetical protein
MKFLMQVGIWSSTTCFCHTGHPRVTFELTFKYQMKLSYFNQRIKSCDSNMGSVLKPVDMNNKCKIHIKHT